LPREGVCSVQFLGFDNSFFYALAQLCIGFAAQEAGLEAVLPSYLYTNEFYQYQHSKFSTSQNHLIWARDLLADYEVGPARFYLCYSNPEYQQTNFDEEDMALLTQKHLSEPLSRIVRCCNERLEGFVPDETLSEMWARILQASCERFAEAYDPESFSLRGAAQALVQHLDLLAERAELVLPDNREEATGVLTALASLRVLAAPIMPQFARELGTAFGNAAGSWEEACRPPTTKYRPVDPGLADLRRASGAISGRVGNR
jgi:methionyl-tRNA synthetase